MVVEPTPTAERPDLSRWLGAVTRGNCLEVMREMPDGCAALAIVDGPYNMRKADWDKFASWDAFREWYRPLWEQLSRVLRDNCSLYVFGTFEGLAALKQDLDALGDGWGYRSYVSWYKPNNMSAKGWADFRCFPPMCEGILFYARERVDISALAWDGVTHEDNTIRAYLDSERERAGVTVREVAEAFQQVTGSRTVTGMAQHWFAGTRDITEENYHWLRDLFNALGNGSGPYLTRPWEDLRYTFNPQQGVTDVWEVPICAGAERVKTADGTTAHVAQKPLAIMRRIIAASSNPDDVVIDPFCGTGTVPVACVEMGREFIGIEREPAYCAIAEERIAKARAAYQPALSL